ncbi:MAG: deoxyguanosinetriphosphate triphosphohydrolase [Gemmatales bacterium]|nr:deoxyguanosinetriphosphate triphosphohydrolase [Gemmatales bacterium]
MSHSSFSHSTLEPPERANERELARAWPEWEPSDNVPRTGYDPFEWEERFLVPYAMRTRLSRGRLHDEPEHPYRTLYQRDRDRIIHSAAFRRLMYKTQVLVNHYSDQHRTRLTHTLEVAQISRTLARQLRLNEDLTEAIALAHDLGHPPFGHAGETALDECMAEHGGFEHNRHGLRLVQFLERRYPGFPGLNLTWEVLESLSYHSKRPDAPEVKRFRTHAQPFLEAQIVDAADSLAYDTHDLDDALQLGLISLEEVRAVPFCRLAEERMRQRYGQVGDEDYPAALVRTLIDWQVEDLLWHTRQRLASFRIRTVEDVRRAPEPIVQPSPEIAHLKAQLEDFLRERVYHHYRVQRMTTKAKRFLRRLFKAYRRVPGMLPPFFYRRIATEGLEQTICDYLASMTDRFAHDEYLRLFHPYQRE